MNRSSARSGFTLVELVVVLSVVALLVGLLLPALGSARAAAQSAVCLSNTRQLGIALNAYLVDSGGRLPALMNRGGTTEPGPALDTLFAEAGPALRCPADSEELWRTTGTSYFWNFTLNGQPIDRLDSLVGGSDHTRVPLVSDKEGFHPNNADRINVLYADGHASNELRFSVTGDPPSEEDL